jgi:methylglutaconyl-CoA hydratase
MSSESLLIDQDARGIVRVTLNRPRVHNALDEELIDELTGAFDRIGRDPTARVVVLGATGRTFCAGADIAWMQRAARRTESENFEDAQRFGTMMHTTAQCSKPVIARVQGPAFGGGVGLACVADIVIATPLARFAVTEARLGILPAVIGPYLINALGPRQARRLALSCTAVPALEALSLGLVHRVVDESELDAAIDASIAELLQGGPQAQAAIKDLFGALPVGPVTSETRRLTAWTLSRVRASEEARAGFEAFMTKRRAPWVLQG